jgi:excisionase family DNA binding protein
MFITTQMAADLLGISRQGVLKAIRRKSLMAEKVGRDWLIDLDAIENYRVRHLGKPGRPVEG